MLLEGQMPLSAMGTGGPAPAEDQAQCEEAEQGRTKMGWNCLNLNAEKAGKGQLTGCMKGKTW